METLLERMLNKVNEERGMAMSRKESFIRHTIEYIENVLRVGLSETDDEATLIKEAMSMLCSKMKHIFSAIRQRRKGE